VSREKLVISCTKQAYTERADECKANRGAKTTDRRRDNSVIYSGSKVLRREARNRSKPRAEKEKKKKKKERKKKRKKKEKEKKTERMSVAGRIIYSAREASPIPQSHFCGEVLVFFLSRRCPLS